MSDLKEATVKNLSIIDPVQRRVLEKRYGLNGETAMAVDEVLAEMGSELVEYVKVRGLRSLHQAAEDDLSRS